MSRFGCTCGYTIVDITDFLPYKAYFLSDEDTETSMELVVNRLAKFVEAREQGKQDEFLAELMPYLKSDGMRTLIRNLFSPPTFSMGRGMYECDECGRIWMQAQPHTNEWVSYLPESDKRGILRHGGIASTE